jgi:hypothetical protein
VGLNLLQLQKRFWDNAKIVCCAGGNHGEPFGAYQGITQGGPLSSLMFNVYVNCVVREWLHQVMGDNIAWEGVGEAVCNHCIPFFADDRLVAARCPVWLQLSFDTLIKLFERIGLLAVVDKTRVVTCVPGKIQVAQTEVECASQQAGIIPTMKRCWVDCDVCGASLAAESLQSHMETKHVLFWLFVLNQDIVIARPAEVYRVIKTPSTGIYYCPVPQCAGTLSTSVNLCQHS